MVPARASGAEVGAAFADLAELLAEDSGIGAYLTALCRHGVGLTGAGCVVLVYADGSEADGGAFGVAASDERGPALAGPSPYADGEPWADCLAAEQLTTVADVRAQASTWPRFTRAAARAGLTALTLIPVTSRGVRTGALALLGDGLPDVAGIMLGLALAGAAAAGLAVSGELMRERSAVTQLQSALTSRIVIEQAKGMLAERWRVGPDEAFVALRRHARAIRRTLSDVARGVIDGSIEVPPGPGPSRGSGLVQREWPACLPAGPQPGRPGAMVSRQTRA